MLPEENLPDELKKDPFLVPEGYFASFPERLRSRIEASPKTDGRTVSLRPLLMMAACTILVLAGMFLYRLLNPAETYHDSTLATYVEESGILDEIDADQIITISRGERTLSEDEIRSWLIEEEIDYNEIIEEL